MIEWMSTFLVQSVTGLFVVTISTVFIFMGVVLSLWNSLCSSRKFKCPAANSQPSLITLIWKKLFKEKRKLKEKQLINSRNLDLCIQELIELVIRDYVCPLLTEASPDNDHFKGLVESEVWDMTERLCQRLADINHVQLLTEDIVNCMCSHLTSIRLANDRVTPEGQIQRFSLHPWLANDKQELDFLRKVAEIFLIHLSSKVYRDFDAVRYLMREVLACCVLKPAIDLICDPDYANQKIYDWIIYQEQGRVEQKRLYLYAANYEEFMDLIVHNRDVDQLLHLRYSIISEIMQAATIRNLKRAKGLDEKGQSGSLRGASKGELLKARNLKRYMNQLTIAKSHCEKQIQLLGGPKFGEDQKDDEDSNIKGKTVYLFNVIMEYGDCQNAFMAYLQKTGHDALLRFWVAVDKMKRSKADEQHVMASQIYQMYISHPTSIVRQGLPRTVIKNMERFMLGNSGVEGFLQAQENVYDTLEEKHYPSFILSDIYHRFIADAKQTDVQKQKGSLGQKSIEDMKKRVLKKAEKEEIAEHTSYATTKLKKIDERLFNKSQALQAVKHSHKEDAKMRKLQEEMEKEIEDLKTKRRHLEFHLERTEVWVEHVGFWKSHIYTTELIDEGDEKVPHFVVVCHLPSSVRQGPVAGYTQGWVVSRTLPDFHELHSRLLHIDTNLKHFDLPGIGKSLFQRYDQKYLDRTKLKLEKYLSYVLRNEQLAQSEAMFIFFSPSPEYLKEPKIQNEKKSDKSFFTNLFRKEKRKSSFESESEDDLVFEDGIKDGIGKDWIATPLYFLLSEIFELRGMFRWLRRTMVLFVKVTYGRSINKQLGDTVAWVISQPMIIYYLNLFKDAYWPNGILATEAAPRSDQDKLNMRRMAKEKVMADVPESLKNLFGEKNARQGMLKMFECIQNEKLNRHLFYDLLIAFMHRIFPEFHSLAQVKKETMSLTKDTKNVDPILHVPMI